MDDFQHRQRLASSRTRHAALQYAAIAALAVLGVVGAVVAYRRAAPSPAPQVETDRVGAVSVVPLDAAQDPHRLVEPDIFIGVEDINPVRRVEGTGLTASVVDMDVLSILLQRLHNTPPDRLRRMAIADFDYDRFNDRRVTQSLRGCVLTVRGSLLRMEPLVAPSLMAAVKEAGIETVFEGQVEDADHGWWSFYCEDPLPGHEMGDLVQLTGVFFKLIKFPTRGGTEKGTPLLVARKLVPVTVSAPPSATARIAKGLPNWAAPVVLVAALAVIVLVVLTVGRSRPRPVRLDTEGLDDLVFEEKPPNEQTPPETAPPEEPPSDRAEDPGSRPTGPGQSS